MCDSQSPQQRSPVKRVFFVRHAQSSEWNKPESMEFKDALCGLSDMGKAEAEHLANSAHDFGLQVLLVSPLLRSIQTAALAFAKLEVPVYLCPSAREIGWHKEHCRGRLLTEIRSDLEAEPESFRQRIQNPEILSTKSALWNPEREATLSKQELSTLESRAHLQLAREITAVNADTVGVVTHWGVISKFLGGGPPNGYNANPCEVIETVWAPLPPGYEWGERGPPPGVFYVGDGQPMLDGRVWVCKFVQSHGYPGQEMVKSLVSEMFGGTEE